jgi:uncharacterized membrane protein YjgN (DUF898 family)
VNLCLTILTLGIYSAWAKVRTTRYFWGSTRLGEASFDYLANPIAILKGRLIVLGFFATYAVVSIVFPLADFAFGLFFLVVLPWAVVRSLVFRARNTAYRNIRFDFRGEYWDAARVYILLPFLMTVTLGLIYPYLIHQQKRLLVDYSAYGTTRFDFAAQVGKFYGLFGRVGLIVIGSILLIANLPGPAFPAAAIAGPPLYLFLFAYMSVGISNLTYNGAALGSNAFRSDLRPGELFAIYLTNVIGIVLTLGLFIPWARVRTARYRIEKISLRAEGDLDSFVAEQLEEVGTVGAEFGDVLDIDIGL